MRRRLKHLPSDSILEELLHIRIPLTLQRCVVTVFQTDDPLGMFLAVADGFTGRPRLFTHGRQLLDLKVTHAQQRCFLVLKCRRA